LRPVEYRYATGIRACLPVFCANGRTELGGASAATVPRRVPVDCRCKAGLPLACGETQGRIVGQNFALLSVLRTSLTSASVFRGGR
jgi:hypothetical protein